MKTRDRVPAAPAGREAEALIERARRRQRRRHWVIAAGVAAVVAVLLAVMASAGGGIWGRFAAQGGKQPPGSGAGALPKLSGHARITYRVVTGGVLQGYGTDDITLAGKNWNSASSTTWPATGREPKQSESMINRIVDEQAHYTVRVHGRPEWVHDPHPTEPGLIFRELPDPRTLLGMLRC